MVGKQNEGPAGVWLVERSWVVNDEFGNKVMLGCCGGYTLESADTVSWQGPVLVPKSCKIPAAGKTVTLLGMRLVYSRLSLTLLAGIESQCVRNTVIIYRGKLLVLHIENNKALLHNLHMYAHT